MRKVLMLTFLGATLSVCAVSVHALTITPTSFVCGGGCTIHPHTFCGGGCFCDTSLGDGMNQGICSAI